MSAPRPTTFKVVQLNAENLFVYLDDMTSRDWKKLPERDWQRLSRAAVANKPLQKTLWLAESILHMDAEIVCLNEVGGPESLSNFARLFLGDKYVPHLIEGNSERGIDVGFLVRRDFQARIELHSHKDRPIQFLYPHEREHEKPGLTSHYFSRDCAELNIFGADPSRPALVILLVHLKSKLDPDGIDPQGKERRRAEATALVQIYQEVRAKWTPTVPVIVAGDFNGCARRDRLADEFSAMSRTDLESVVELAGLSEENAATQIQFNRGGVIQPLQIDFIFISPDLKPHLLAEAVAVYRYHSDLRVALPLPKTLEQRNYLPSDHYPVIATFKNFITP